MLSPKLILLPVLYALFDQSAAIRALMSLSILCIPWSPTGRPNWSLAEAVKKLTIWLSMASVVFLPQVAPEAFCRTILWVLLMLNVLEMGIYALLHRLYGVGLLLILASCITPDINRLEASPPWFFIGYPSDDAIATKAWLLAAYSGVMITYNLTQGTNRLILNLALIVPFLYESLPRGPRGITVCMRCQWIFITNWLDTFVDPEYWDLLQIPAATRLFDSQRFNRSLHVLAFASLLLATSRFSIVESTLS